ncbi:GumC family protein [Terriglobus aquaticus]|uniref:non-specific protein-tyrosine kinase n=1 Tax=Terriglobus aquaticus TaxID=940139 RepID=A0ABW9KGE8_9BACT|nr:polysaccharide biosynthesis tyrosine autokinase [Terriglobus aquaticus]
MGEIITSESNHVVLSPTSRIRDAAPARAIPVPSADPKSSLLMEYVQVLRRHWMAILSCAVAGCVVALALSLLQRPLYRTRASVDIEGLNGDFMNMRAVARTDGSTAEPNEVKQQTEIKLLQSDTLIDSTIQSLLAQGESVTPTNSDVLQRTAQRLHVPGHSQLRFEDVVRDTSKRVKVKPLGMTRLVELSCESTRPDIAARFCNQMIREFETEDIETRAEEAQKTSAWLTRQLADVKAKAEESQRKLQAAVGGNGLMLSQETSSTGEERLRELQEELVKAQADRMQREANIAVAHTAAIDSLPGVQDSPTYRQYETRLAELRGKLAEIVPPLTEQNPKVIHLRSQIQEAEEGLAASRSSSTSRESSELTAAQHRENLLRAAYNAQLATVSTDLQKAAQVSLLRRELESEQQLYQTMLQRAKEAGFASAMQGSTVRIVDPARPSLNPASPNRTADGAAGFALAGVLGAGMFLYRDRTRRVFRLPGETQALLQVQELGVIPHATRTTVAGTRPSYGLVPSLRTADTAMPQVGEAVALTRWEDRSSITAEAYRSTGFSLLLADAQKKSKVYAVSSASDGEGKTTVVSNLGVALSRTRLRILLIDGDLRKPRLHASFGMRMDFGLRNLLRGEIDVTEAAPGSLYRQTPIHNLSIIPAGGGSEDSVELLHSPNVEKLLNRLRTEFDIILVDTPPMLHMADARVLAVRCDGGILVVRAHETDVDQAQAARDIFDSDGIPIVGTILNSFTPTREGLRDYYKSYERYQGDEDGSKVAAA